MFGPLAFLTWLLKSSWNPEFYDELIPLIRVTCLDASTHLSPPDFLQLPAQPCRPGWAFQEITKPAYLTLASFQQVCIFSALASHSPLQCTLSLITSNTATPAPTAV